ncbi:MAG: hypothetical protein HRT54_00370 [Colwellia sp.]|nr:hypothetical protein [Colwellia sp.]
MMINVNYNEIIAQAKTKGASQANFNNINSTRTNDAINQNTLTLSNQALSLLEGNKNIIQEISPIYVRPQTSAELLAGNQSSQSNLQVTTSSSDEIKIKDTTETNSRFGDMMQAILDKRLGVDRKKLEELDAMMAEIAKNENLSPEEKEKAMEEIGKMREKIIEESIDIKKIAKETFIEPDENG